VLGEILLQSVVISKKTSEGKGRGFRSDGNSHRHGPARKNQKSAHQRKYPKNRSGGKKKGCGTYCEKALEGSVGVQNSGFFIHRKSWTKTH